MVMKLKKELSLVIKVLLEKSSTDAREDLEKFFWKTNSYRISGESK
jgi:hypothetical protein